MKLPFRSEKELYSSFYKILGFYPKDIRYYKQALLHKSSSVKSEQGKWINNERLEFLGDAILDAIVGDVVYRRFEGKKEGFLTNARSKIVQRETLNKVAVEIGLHRLIKFSANSNTSHNSNMCGNAFEALIGAIYLDRGYDYCMHFMQTRILGSHISVDFMAYKEVNFKSKLIEWSQKNKVNISFEVIDQTSETDGGMIFSSQVFLSGIACGVGKGHSKKESQQLAAQETLEMLKKTGFTSKILEKRNEPAQKAAPAKKENLPAVQEETIEIDFNQVGKIGKTQKLSKEEIIAAAENAAFEEEN